jgi:hypothetical protein
MPPDEQKQFVARMKERGQDVSMFETPARSDAPPAAAGKTGPATAQSIDALFGPLPTVESRGNAWAYENKQLKRVPLRLGITDGTQTEVLGGDLQPGMEVVTGVIVGNVRQTPQGNNNGNPLLPNQRGGGPGGFGGGRGRG